MEKTKLFWLMWVPGLFWLFPFWLKQQTDSEGWWLPHGVYAGTQVGIAFCFLYACS